MSRMIWVNRYQSPPKPVYEELYNLVKDKDYFVLTTNVDHCFQKAGSRRSASSTRRGISGFSSAACHAGRKLSTMKTRSGQC